MGSLPDLTGVLRVATSADAMLASPNLKSSKSLAKDSAAIATDAARKAAMLLLGASAGFDMAGCFGFDL